MVGIFRMTLEFAKTVLAIIIISLCTLNSPGAGASTDDLYRQMDAMGIRLGMTIAEARALIVPQGGEIRLAQPSNQPLTEKVVQLGDPKRYFEYLATPIPLPKQQTHPRSKRPANPVAIKHPDFYVTLYVYPRNKGGWDDPDNLVIYALRTSRVFSMRRSPFGAPSAAGNAPGVTLESFLKGMAPNYGPVRELITGGDNPEFAFLPDMNGGKSFSMEDIKAAPRDNYKAKAVTSSCSYMGHQVHRAYSMSYKLSLDTKGSSLISQKGLAGFIGANPEMAPGTYAAWGGCGEVTYIQAPLDRQNLTRIGQINLFRYSRDYYERAMQAFAAGL
jgi:hypothetical protein